MKEILIKNLPELEAFAAEFAAGLKGGAVIGLIGDLGAGKTTFVQAAAKALGIKKAVKSPTFILLQAFDTSGAAKKRGIRQVCHVDAYRLKDTEELFSIGFEEYAHDRGTVCFVEWADRVPAIHGYSGYVELTFAFDAGDQRRILIGK